jgi:hypothetical protein
VSAERDWEAIAPARPTQVELLAAPSLKAAMRDLDAQRARSKQRKIGASEVGECRRRAAYRIAGVKATNKSVGMQAALGTAIHKDVLAALKRAYGGLTEVHCESEQLKGHADWVDTDSYAYPVVEDLKTVSKNSFTKVSAQGAYTKHWFQVTLYAWLMRTGHITDRRLRKVGTDSLDVAGVRIRYLDRDSGEDVVHAAEYDPHLAAEAIMWLTEVYETVDAHGGGLAGAEATERDGYGPDVDMMCDWCPFLDACWGPQPEDPYVSRQSRVLIVTDTDFEEALRDYEESRRAEAEASRRKEFAKKRLMGRTGSAGGLHCQWVGGNEIVQVDTKAALERLRELEGELPVRTTRSARAIRVSKAAEG